jgi:hypothetical protein
MENTLSLSELKDLLLKRFKITRSDWEGADSGGGGMSYIDEYYELKELTVTPGIEKLLNNTSFPNESEKITWKLESYPLTDEDKYILKDAFDISDEELGDNPMWQEYLVVDKYNSIINKERAIIGSTPDANLEQDAKSSMKINESIIKNKMKTTTLRELIRESIQAHIREIDMVSEIAAIESKIAEAKNAIEERKSKLTKADELNESGLIDEKIVKKIQKEVALLEKYASKQEALLEKKKAKTKKDKNKEVNDDVITEEPMEEIDGLEEAMMETGGEFSDKVGETLEQMLNNMNVSPEFKQKAYQTLQDEEFTLGDYFNSSKPDDGATAAAEYILSKVENEEADVNQLNESFLRMQKLAGIIKG